MVLESIPAPVDINKWPLPKPYMHDDKPHMYDDMTDIKDDMTDINDDMTDMYEYHIHVWYHVAWGDNV